MKNVLVEMKNLLSEYKIIKDIEGKRKKIREFKDIRLFRLKYKDKMD